MGGNHLEIINFDGSGGFSMLDKRAHNLAIVKINFPS